MRLAAILTTRTVVKLFNAIQQSQAANAAAAEELKAQRGTGKPTLPAPAILDKKKKGKQKDNIVGSGKGGKLTHFACGTLAHCHCSYPGPGRFLGHHSLGRDRLEGMIYACHFNHLCFSLLASNLRYPALAHKYFAFTICLGCVYQLAVQYHQ